MAERRAEEGEVCTCGRQAVTVFITERFGEVGWCGRSDGGDSSGPCPFCGGARHDGDRCPAYQLRPATPQASAQTAAGGDRPATLAGPSLAEMTAARLGRLARLAAHAAEVYAATNPAVARVFADTALQADSLAGRLPADEQEPDGAERTVTDTLPGPSAP